MHIHAYIYIYIQVLQSYPECRVRFVHLMKQAARRRQPSGHVMVKGGVPFPKAARWVAGGSPGARENPMKNGDFMGNPWEILGKMGWNQ